MPFIELISLDFVWDFLRQVLSNGIKIVGVRSKYSLGFWSCRASMDIERHLEYGSIMFLLVTIAKFEAYAALKLSSLVSLSFVDSFSEASPSNFLCSVLLSRLLDNT